jgi:hypothetical protein
VADQLGCEPEPTFVVAALAAVTRAVRAVAVVSSERAAVPLPAPCR